MDSLRAPFIPLAAPGSGQAAGKAAAVPAFSGTSFADRLNGAVLEVNGLQKTSDLAAEKVILGELEIHEGMMALQKADLSMRLLVQVRAKSLEAYKEIMHMQF